MQIIAAWASEAPVSVHEWSQSVSIVTLMWAVIALLGAAVLWYALGDRSEIKNALNRLITVVEELRLDLAENYAKKVDVEKLDRKIDRLRDHMTARGHLSEDAGGD